jgi:cell division protease FtsH
MSTSRPPKPARPSPAVSIAIAGSLMLVLSLGLIFWLASAPKSIDYSDLLNLIAKGKVEKVVFIGADRIEGEIKPDQVNDAEVHELGIRRGRFQTELVAAYNKELVEKLATQNVKIDRRDDPSAWMTPMLTIAIPILIVLAVIVFFVLPRMRDPAGGFVAQYLRSPARRYERGKSPVTFDDVADMENAKSELREVIDFLREPKKFERLGGQVPKGVLLIGPPGTGKTLLAKATAGEAEVPFFSMNAAEFIQLYVGVGASRVRDLFKTSKESAPCLIFIDEIDAIGRIRGSGLGGGADEREQTLNQILGEMDGFSPSEMVIVIAATNRPDVLDPALLRPGRFDRHITVDRQSWHGRLAVLKVHTRNKPLAESVDLEVIARQTIGMTGADLRNLANEAALLATREGKDKIERIDFERAADRVLIGPKREEVLSPEEKRATAYHEAGHALLTWLIPEADRPMKVSIVPRGRSLGMNLIIPEEERYHHGENYFKAQLAVRMGGRAAERLVFDQSFAGAEDDLRQATRLARYMVSHWGMSERVGPVSLRIGEEHVFLGKEIQQSRDFSEGMATIVDEETRKILLEAEQRAVDLLRQNRAKLDRLVDELLKREELSRAEIDAIVNQANPARQGGGAPDNR